MSRYIDKKIKAPDPLPTEDYCDEVLRITNKIRRKVGAPRLHANSKLREAAMFQAEYQAYIEKKGHNGPKNFPSPVERVTATGYLYSYVSENVARGQQTPEWVIDSLMKSDGHRRNIESTEVSETGVHVVRSGSGRIYWCMVFAHPQFRQRKQDPQLHEIQRTRQFYLQLSLMERENRRSLEQYTVTNSVKHGSLGAKIEIDKHNQTGNDKNWNILMGTSKLKKLAEKFILILDSESKERERREDKKNTKENWKNYATSPREATCNCRDENEYIRLSNSFSLSGCFCCENESEQKQTRRGRQMHLRKYQKEATGFHKLGGTNNSEEDKRWVHTTISNSETISELDNSTTI